jgi:hypothetical protein
MTITVSVVAQLQIGTISVWVWKGHPLAKLLQVPFLFFSMEARNLLYLNILLKMQVQPLSLNSV